MPEPKPIIVENTSQLSEILAHNITSALKSLSTANEGLAVLYTTIGIVMDEMPDEHFEAMKLCAEKPCHSKTGCPCSKTKSTMIVFLEAMREQCKWGHKQDAKPKGFSIGKPGLN